MICARTLLDFVPPETEHYSSALLWKHLRELCEKELARTMIAGSSVRLRVATLDG